MWSHRLSANYTRWVLWYVVYIRARQSSYLIFVFTQRVSTNVLSTLLVRLINRAFCAPPATALTANDSPLLRCQSFGLPQSRPRKHVDTTIAYFLFQHAVPAQTAARVLPPIRWVSPGVAHIGLRTVRHAAISTIIHLCPKLQALFGRLLSRHGVQARAKRQSQRGWRFANSGLMKASGLNWTREVSSRVWRLRFPSPNIGRNVSLQFYQSSLIVRVVLIQHIDNYKATGQIALQRTNHHCHRQKLRMR
jgi:hypothetical protein